MLKLRKITTDWMSEKILNGVEKAYNRTLNIGNNTRAPMEGCIRGVRPFKTHRINTAFCRNQPKKRWLFNKSDVF